MRYLPLLFVIAAGGCKDKAKPAAKPAPDAKVEVAVTPDAAAPSIPLVPEAGPAQVAPDEACQPAADYFQNGLKAGAVDRGVPAEQLDKAREGLVAAFVRLCRDDDWPLSVLDCVGKNPASLPTYTRCFERLPTAKRNAWFTALDEVMATVGGQTIPVPATPDATGETFEQICPTFVNEVSRMDNCMGAGSYSPEVEQVYMKRRELEYGGLIHPARRDAMLEACTKGAQIARTVASEQCPHLRQ